jgi:hypothetical protein
MTNRWKPLKPFFLLYGGKWILAKPYGPPQCDHVIELFAGSAGYSAYWRPKEVTLIERDPVIYGVWDYLLHVRPAELMRLPSNISDLNELPASLPEGARSLIGFWFDASPSKPAVQRSNWALIPRRRRFYWSETIKHRIASQLDAIRHWKIIHGTWEDAPDIYGHWHVDPPYSNDAGKLYTFNSIDYPALASWCKRRRGFVQVCEHDGAMWLPFQPRMILKSHRPRGYSAEAVCEIDNRPAGRRT